MPVVLDVQPGFGDEAGIKDTETSAGFYWRYKTTNLCKSPKWPLGVMEDIGIQHMHDWFIIIYQFLNQKSTVKQALETQLFYMVIYS